MTNGGWYRRSALVTLLVLVLGPLAAPASAERLEVCAVDLLVRAEPDGPGIGTLYRGQTFDVERRSDTGRWAYGFAYGHVNRHGWVLAS